MELVTPELRDYMSIVRRRKVLIALVAGIVVLVTLTYSLTRTPIYEAGAQVLIQKRETDMIIGTSPPSDPEAVRAEMTLMRSAAITSKIADALGYLPEPTFKAAPQTTPGVQVFIRNQDAEQAAKEANDFANAYVALRRGVIDDELAGAIAAINKQKADLAVEVAESQTRLAELTLEYDRETDDARRRLLLAQIEQLALQVDSLSLIHI